MRRTRTAGWGLAGVVGFALVVAICDRGHGDATPTLDALSSTSTTASTDPSPSAVITATVPAGVEEPYPLAPVGPGAPCPWAAAVCDYGVRVWDAVAANDVDALLALSAPVAFDCARADPGWDVTEICDRVDPDGTAPAYYEIHAGEGSPHSEASFRRYAGAWLQAGADALARQADGYGSGELRMASVGCSTRSGKSDCHQELSVAFTFIGTGQPVGIPGKRITFKVSARWIEAEGRFAANSVGLSIPPNMWLYAFTIPVHFLDGTTATLDVRPWTP